MATDDGRRARVAGSGSFLPPHRLDNHELFGRETIRAAFDVERARASLSEDEDAGELEPVEVFDRWAQQVTGIRARRVVTDEDGLVTEDLCARAGRRALDDAGMEPEDLDFVIASSVTARDEVPNVACTVAEKLGVPTTPGFTLNAACAGFVYAVAAAHAHIRSGMGENVLAIAGDALSHVTDYTDPKTAVLFGDGSGAVVLTPGDGGEGVLGVPYHEADYSSEHLSMRGQGWAEGEDEDLDLHMEGGPRVLRRAIYAMKRVSERAVEQAGLAWPDVDVVIPHQANLRITKGLERVLPLEDGGRVVHVIEEYGNVSASTVGITLDETLRGEHGPVPEPAHVVLSAVGGGYTSAGLVLRVGGG